MHAFLFVGKDENNLKNFVDSKIKEEKVIQQIPFILQKIDDVRELKKMTKFSFNNKTAIIINNIDSATVECLNAFLKDLEEPNKNLIYILTASNFNNLLPTITSRCETFFVDKKQNSQELHQDARKFLKGDINKRFEIVSKIKEREEALNLVKSLIFIDKENNYYKNFEDYLICLTNLKANGNISLQLTNLITKLKIN